VEIQAREIGLSYGRGASGAYQDEETGLYYFGARYYDPRTSLWQSADPALGKFLPTRVGTEAGLPGLGGIYNSFNLGLYTYGHQNPVRYVDPDGRFTLVEVAVAGTIIVVAAIAIQANQNPEANKAIGRALNRGIENVQENARAAGEKIKNLISSVRLNVC